MSEKKSAGQPTKYKPEYCQMLIDHMTEGYSLESFAGVIGVARDTLYEWRDTHKEFSDTIRISRAAQLTANEKLIRDIAKYGEGNATAAIFILKNCHPQEWRDRKEVEVTSPNKMTDDELIKEAEEILSRCKK